MCRKYLSLALCCLVAACSNPPPQNDSMAVPDDQSPVTPPPAAITQPAAAPVSDDLNTVVPLEDDGGTFLIPVTINDAISLKFTIDSGASDVTIPSDVASTLVRAGTISSADYIGSKTFVLADGSTIPSPEFRIRSLKVGNLVLHDVIASVTGSDGSLLLGQTFLARLKHWSIDNDRHVLLLTARERATEPLDDSPTSATVAAISSQADSIDAVSPAIQAGAKRAVGQFFNAWSNPDDPDGTSMRRFYAETVNFYGKQMTIDQLMAEKLRFARRWPIRSYVVDQNSLQISCSNQNPICTIAGDLQWTASGPGGTRTSSGRARFALSYEGGEIIEEHGRVLSREGSRN